MNIKTNSVYVVRYKEQFHVAVVLDKIISEAIYRDVPKWRCRILDTSERIKVRRSSVITYLGNSVEDAKERSAKYFI